MADVTHHLYAVGEEAPEIWSSIAQVANHGLRFQKFFGRWSRQSPSELLKSAGNRTTEPILDWLNPTRGNFNRPPSVSETLPIGCAKMLAEASRRTAALALARAKAVLGQAVSQDAVTVEMTLVSRLLTGIGLPHPTENGFLFHPTLAVPYLRGTALKQVARDRAVADGENRERIANLFGGVEGNTPTNAGCIAFLDALPTKEVTLTAEQITAHYGDYYGQDDPFADDRIEPGDWHEPNPVTLLALEQGPVFPISIIPLAIGGKPPTRDDLKDVLGWLSEGLEFNGIGARTTLGFGRLQSVDSKKAEDARRPLATGDATIVDNEYHDAKFRGQVGVIEEIYKNQPMAKVRFVINGKGKQKPIPLAHLGRAPETP